MRLPRDLSGEQLVKLLAKVGYEPTRQTGSHIRVTTQQGGEHHLTVPRHKSLRIGTLNNVVQDAARHLGRSRDELLRTLLG